MALSIFQEILLGATQAFRTIIPEPQHRTPVSWKAIPVAALAFVPFFFMGYLSRRPDTYYIRLLLLPTVIYTTLGPAYRYAWIIPSLNVFNWGQCLLAEVVLIKAFEFALTREGMLKSGERMPGEMEHSVVTNGVSELHGKGIAIVPPSSDVLPSWLYDALDVSYSLRGIGWEYGKATHIPSEFRPKDRSPFLRVTAISFLRNFMILDFLDSLLKLFPGVGNPEGGTIFYPVLAPVQRYAVSTLIHMISGSCLLAGFQMVYDLVTIIGVGLCGSSPSSWPPTMDNPWSSDSLHTFWSKRWHQFLRQTFLIAGGYPGKWIGGDLGMVFGAFVASGLFHECAMYSMHGGWDHRVTLFFAMQGPLLVLERVWRKVSGRRVSGWIGRLWVYFILFIAAQPVIDSWHRRGLAGCIIVPPFISPTRLLLLPWVQDIVNRQLSIPNVNGVAHVNLHLK